MITSAHLKYVTLRTPIETTKTLVYVWQTSP